MLTSESNQGFVWSRHQNFQAAKNRLSSPSFVSPHGDASTTRKPCFALWILQHVLEHLLLLQPSVMKFPFATTFLTLTAVSAVVLTAPTQDDSTATRYTSFVSHRRAY